MKKTNNEENTVVGRVVIGPAGTTSSNGPWQGGLHKFDSFKDESQTVQIKEDGSVEPVVTPNIGTIVLYFDDIDGVRPAIIMKTWGNNQVDLNVFGKGSIYYMSKIVFSEKKNTGCWWFI